MTDIPIRWEARVSPGQKAYFTSLLAGLARDIDPGDSLKEVRIIADDALVSEVQSLTGEPYQPGPHVTDCAAVAVEQGNTFSSVILIRQVFFTPGDEGPLKQQSGLIGALSHCHLYHQAWQRRGYISPRSADPYSRDLFVMCQQIHDAYAVARLKNMLLSKRLPPRYMDAQGQPIPLFMAYGESLTKLFDQAPDQLHTRGIPLTPSMRKQAMLPIVYRLIFEPLASYAGFLAPIPPDYPLRNLDNNPEESAFYRDIIASYWTPIQSDLEASFDSQFSKTEEALQAIAETMDACLNRLLEV